MSCRSMSSKLRFFSVPAGALVAQMSFAGAFDFESVAYGTYSNPRVVTGADNTLTVSSAGGLLWLSEPNVTAPATQVA